MTYIPEHFAHHELVPPALSNLRPEAVFRLFDDRLLKTADRLRNRYGKMTVNNHFWGGSRTESGLRDPFTDTGAKYSQHKFGRALDKIPANVTAEQIRLEILADPWHPDFKYITCLEMTIGGEPISWLHTDVRNWDKQKYGILQLHL